MFVYFQLYINIQLYIERTKNHFRPIESTHSSIYLYVSMYAVEFFFLSKNRHCRNEFVSTILTNAILTEILVLLSKHIYIIYYYYYAYDDIIYTYMHQYYICVHIYEYNKLLLLHVCRLYIIFHNLF